MKTKEKELEESRKKIFEESKFIANNQKYGLFSFPGTLAIAKSPYFNETKSHKGKDGTVQLGPANILTRATRTGNSPCDYFSPPLFSSDKYTSNVSFFASEKERTKGMLKNHDTKWKPPGKPIENLSLYEHKPSETLKTIKRKQLDGSVLTDPRNFYTSPGKKGSTTPGITFGKYPEYMSDPYDLKKPKKIVNSIHDSPFKSTDFGSRYFTKDLELYNNESLIKKPQKKSVSHSWAPHDLPFRPSGKVSYAFNKPVEYIPSPPMLKKRVKNPDCEKEPWRCPISARSSPTPSISKNSCNLRTEFPVLKQY